MNYKHKGQSRLENLDETVLLYWSTLRRSGFLYHTVYSDSFPTNYLIDKLPAKRSKG